MELTARLGPDATEALRLTRDTFETGELYRLVTAHFVHLSAAHSFMNQLGLLFLTVVLIEVLSAQRLLLASLACGFAISVATLVWHPELAHYVGFSGVTHGLFASGGIALLRGGQLGYGALVLVTVTAKLLWEAVMGPTPGAEDAVGGPIFIESHLYGAIGGAAFGLYELARRRASRVGLGKPGIVLVAVCAVLLALATPRAARAHGETTSMMTLAFLETGEALLRIETATPAFVLRQPLNALSPDMRERVAQMDDAELQGYLDGASDYLLSRAQLTTEDGQVIRPRSIRVPTLERLREDAMQPRHHAEFADLFLLFAAPDLAEAPGALQLVLPPELGSYGFLVLSENAKPLFFRVSLGAPSPPFPVPASE